MRTRIPILIATFVVAAATTAAAQKTWLPCPQCQTDDERDASRAKGANDAFDPRDFSGVWNQNRNQLSPGAAPLTPWGKERYEATMSVEITPGAWLGKDPMLICDPLGWPRWFTYNYGVEFVMLPDRILHFFEWGHTYRTIWIDGRELPKDPDPRWMGYSVGRWEGNTLVVESTGFDERSWLSENRRDRRWGWPHSEELRTVEAYRRVSANVIESSLTIIDPKAYTQPWVTVANILRSPGTELGEYFCVPSEADEHTRRVREPATGVK
jgi:hypothetical protein